MMCIPVIATDAPRAAFSRGVRRAWAAEVNRVLRETGDRERACKAGAVLIASALDCDAISHRVADAGWWGRWGTVLPAAAVTLPRDAEARRLNRDGTLDRMVEAILRDQAPGDRDWPMQNEVSQ